MTFVTLEQCDWIKRTKMDIVDKIGQYEEIEQILDENMNRRTQ